MADTLMTNDTLPVLVIRAPECGHCGNEVEADPDGLHCAGCGVQWSHSDHDGTPGRPIDDIGSGYEKCGHESESQPSVSNMSGGRRVEWLPELPCILPEGHDSHHLHPAPFTVTETSEGAGA